MTFLHPAMLFGLVLIGVPILLHLIMRQKPRRLPFPALRFLLQRLRTNQRKMQLRHLLLLLLRMGLIACICLALARPKIFNERLNISGDRAMALALVFDTTPSMGYEVNKVSRLDEAKKLALELLDGLPEGSVVAVLDSAAPGEEEFRPAAHAREKITSLQVRSANFPLTHQLAHAYELFAKHTEGQGEGADPALPFLYVFSDRAQACWDAEQTANLTRLRDRVTSPPVAAAFVDVGLDQPSNLSIVDLELPRQIVPVNDKVEINAMVRSTGRSCETEVLCRIDGEEVDRKPVQLEADKNVLVKFQAKVSSPGWRQVEVLFRTPDPALTSDDVRYATFEVRGSRGVLTITDNPAHAKIWNLALGVGNAFQPEVISTREAFDRGADNLARYKVICLLGVTRPIGDQRQPGPDLWEKLHDYVKKGGSLAIIPGGSAMNDKDGKDAYFAASPFAQALAPARFEDIVKADKPGVTWREDSYQHPVLLSFRDWAHAGDIDFLKTGLRFAANRYWDVQPIPGESHIIVSYADEPRRPALVERKLDRKEFRGKVLLYTTPLDDEHVAPRDRDTPPWSNYLESSFYIVLARQTIGYLAGDADEGNFNFTCGQNVFVSVPAAPRFPTYTVVGPGLSGSDAIVNLPDGQTELSITRAVERGNYAVMNGDGKRVAAFSLNDPPLESLLTKFKPEPIEALFGPDSVLTLDDRTNFRDALASHWKQPLELYPWLMIALLLLLAVENLLANKFYRREETGDAATEPSEARVEQPAAVEAMPRTAAPKQTVGASSL
jgi:hypothetical protein